MTKPGVTCTVQDIDRKRKMKPSKVHPVKIFSFSLQPFSSPTRNLFSVSFFLSLHPQLKTCHKDIQASVGILISGVKSHTPEILLTSEVFVSKCLPI